MNGTVNPNGQGTVYAFQWGPTSGYGHETSFAPAGSGATVAAVAQSITGLRAGTTYHYRVFATSGGGIATSSDRTFTTSGTAPAPSPAPVATTTAATSVGQTNATLNGTANPNGQSTQYHFEYGTTTAYGYQTGSVSAGSGTSVVGASITLPALNPGTTYHYRLVAVSNGGTALGADQTLKTSGPPATPSRVGLFGRTAFMSPSGVAGIMVGCIGGSSCTGSLTLSRSGATLGQRLSFVIASNDGGFVHVQLTSLGKRLVNQRRRLRVNVAVTEMGGNSQTGILTIAPFG
jgi:hypothetical protein